MDDLDNLLSELESTTPISKKTKQRSEASKGTDDLEDLLNSLNIDSNGKLNKDDEDELNSLLLSLESKSDVNEMEHSGAKEEDSLDSLLSSFEQPMERRSQAYTGDELDDLLTSLEDPTPRKTPQKQVVVEQNKTPKPEEEDLDSLLESLDKPMSNREPVTMNNTQSSVPPPKEEDDLDSLLMSLESREAIQKPQPVQKPVQRPQPDQSPSSPPITNQPIQKDDDDLDSLLMSLENREPIREAQPTQKPPTNQPSQIKKDDDDLDSLLLSLEKSSPSDKKEEDDLDSLLQDLESGQKRTQEHPQAEARASPSFQPSRSTAPSSSNPDPSRFNRFLSDVSSQVSDIDKDRGSTQTCFKCGHAIAEDAIRVLGKAYHPYHFDCFTCGSTIGTRNFYEVKGEPNCEQCYQKQFCPTCYHCGKAITDRCVTALNKKWHVNCFVCTQCVQPFSGNFFEKDERPYCEKCYHQIFASRCKACNQPIYGDCINALGSQWHPEHFNCQYCHKEFTGMFFELDGMPYCETHYYLQMGETCHGCDQPIAGASVDAMGKKWHPEHFVCSFCMNQLSGSSFSEKNNKPYCKPCHSKLFS